jgi:hypothetical protein
VNPKILLHAVVRYDEYISEITDAVTVVAVVPTKDEALQEVERLNRLAADKGSIYFWTPARYYSAGRGVVIGEKTGPA